MTDFAHKEGEKLCAAVAKWISALGGTPLEVGQIKVLEGGKKRTFTVSLTCRGWMPDLKYRLPPSKGRRTAK